MPEAADAQPVQLGGGAALRAVAAAAAAGAGSEGGLAGPELLKLAAALRMNTGEEGVASAPYMHASKVSAAWVVAAVQHFACMRPGAVCLSRLHRRTRHAPWRQLRTGNPELRICAAPLGTVCMCCPRSSGTRPPPRLPTPPAADVRRAVFCVVMGAEDCVDAVERLLRLGLKGEQEREVVRVTVECCLQASRWWGWARLGTGNWFGAPP